MTLLGIIAKTPSSSAGGSFSLGAAGNTYVFQENAIELTSVYEACEQKQEEWTALSDDIC